MKFSAWQKTIHLPSGEYLAKKLLLSFSDAPGTGNAGPPFPPLKGMRNKSYLNSFSREVNFSTSSRFKSTLSELSILEEVYRSALLNRTSLPSGDQFGLLWT